MKIDRLLALWLACSTDRIAWTQSTVTFPLLKHQGTVQGDLYGLGTRGVVLAHGGRFTKESWNDQANALAKSGFLVLAVRFRGDGLNPGGSPGSFGSSADNAEDVLAAVSYLHRNGVHDVSAVGASLGGDAVGDAAAACVPGVIARIVLLASTGGDYPEKLKGEKLFIVAREDRSASGLRLPEISSHYARAPEPKRLLLLEGSAHAQFLFQTGQARRVMNEIQAFLLHPR